MTDRNLRFLTPQKCYTSLNFSGMTQITAQGVLDVVERHPNIPLRLIGCQAIQKEIEEGKLSLEELLKLATPELIKDLFSSCKLLHYKKKLTDAHIFKLIQERKIRPFRFLNVSNMPHLHSAGFSQLMKEVKPEVVKLLAMPQLYGCLKFVVADVIRIVLSKEGFGVCNSIFLQIVKSLVSWLLTRE